VSHLEGAPVQGFDVAGEGVQEDAAGFSLWKVEHIEGLLLSALPPLSSL